MVSLPTNGTTPPKTDTARPRPNRAGAMGVMGEVA